MKRWGNSSWTKQRLGVVVMTMLLIGTAAACGDDGEGSSASSATGEAFTLGVVLELSGPLEALGRTELDAIQLAVDNPLVDIERPVELSVHDSTSTPEGSAAAAQQLVRDGVTAVIGTANAASCTAMAPILSRAEALHYCMSPVPQEPNPTLFLALPSLDSYEEPIVTWFEDQGFESLAVIHTSDRSGEAAVTFGEQYAAAAGMTVVGAEVFDPATTNVEAQMTTLRGTNPDLIYVGAGGQNVLPVLQAMNALGMTQPVYFNPGAIVPEVAELVKDSLPSGGVFGNAAWVDVASEMPEDEPNYSIVQDFVSLYEEEFGATPSVLAAAAWDVAQQIITAVADGAESGPDIASFLEGSSPTGVLGEYSFSADVHQGATQPAGMLEFGADGKFHLAFLPEQ
jgi:branched-chain amino acid transport system substrate-binding protein